MKLTDYLVNYLASLGIKQAFVITGSAIAEVIDSFHKVKGIDYVCVQHEQAGAMAAEAYSRISENLGVAISTSGPGGTNLITGICCAWFDSIPCLYISGQVFSRFTKGDRPIRQIGFQETDIVSIVKPITKYAHMVKSAGNIKYELDKAVYYATSGRPGPVLIDLPIDVQRAEINPDNLEGFSPEEEIRLDSETEIEGKIDQYLEKLKKAERPVILVGGGLRLSKTADSLYEFLAKVKMPVVSTWPAMDIFDHNYPLYRGRIGTYGMRGANFTFQNSDLTLSLGSRHSGRQTGGRVDTFARAAARFIVDVDQNELKHQTVKCHVNINCHLKDFFRILLRKLDQDFPDFSEWVDKTKEWKDRYPCCLPEYYELKNQVNPYVFMKELSKQCQEGDVIVGDCGGNIVPLAQVFEAKKNQRIISAWAHSPMGYALAASMGACLANKNPQRTICTIGDGGMQVNIQELQTIKNYNLPIKVFIMNNHSYGIIKQFQDVYLDSRYEASGKGYSHPDFVKVAQAYGLATETIKNHEELNAKIRRVLNFEGPIICDIDMPDKLTLVPRLGWNTPIEDQYPYLPRKEFRENMFIEPLENKQAEENPNKEP